MILSSCCFLILSIPTVWELWRERNGEAPEHKKRSTLDRVILMISAGVLVTTMMHPKEAFFWGTDYFGLLNLSLLKCLFLSFAIFFLFFDYCINLILGRKPWYAYLSKSPIDQRFSKVGWRWRMAVRVVVFAIAATWFYY